MKHATRILVCVIAVSKWQEFLLKVRRLFMAALRVADSDKHYIFVLWFLLLLSFFLFFSPNLSRRRLDAQFSVHVLIVAKRLDGLRCHLVRR